MTLINEDVAGERAHRVLEELGTVVLGIPGKHNVLNSLAALAMASRAGVPFDRIKQALESFRRDGQITLRKVNPETTGRWGCDTSAKQGLERHRGAFGSLPR